MPILLLALIVALLIASPSVAFMPNELLPVTLMVPLLFVAVPPSARIPTESAPLTLMVPVLFAVPSASVIIPIPLLPLRAIVPLLVIFPLVAYMAVELLAELFSVMVPPLALTASAVGTHSLKVGGSNRNCFVVASDSVVN